MLPLIEYSGRKLLTCFNIYSRPKKGINKKSTNYKLKDVEILEWRRGGSYKAPTNYDIGICAWGSGIGKEIKKQGQYALENYIVVHNTEHKEEVVNAIRSAKWNDIYPCIATPRLGQWKIYKYLREQIPTLL